MPEIPRGVDFSGVGFLAEWISRGIRLAIREIRRRILVMARPMSWMIHFRRQLRRLYRSTRSTAILAVQTVNGSVRRAFRNPRASRSTRSVGATIPIESRVRRTICRIWALWSGEFAMVRKSWTDFPRYRRLPGMVIRGDRVAIISDARKAQGIRRGAWRGGARRASRRV